MVERQSCELIAHWFIRPLSQLVGGLLFPCAWLEMLSASWFRANATGPVLDLDPSLSDLSCSSLGVIQLCVPVSRRSRTLSGSRDILSRSGSSS